MPRLYVVGGDGQIFSFSITRNKVSIGRSRDNDICLSDNTVSRRHAEIIRKEKTYFLADLGSYNGTRVNGKAVQTASLKHKDNIQIGLSTLTFLEKSDASAELAASPLLTAEESDGRGGQRIVESSPPKDSKKSHDLLFIASAGQKADVRKLDSTGKRPSGAEADLSALARTNKVLFVLYEISRQLNQIHDFNELLKRIMDLIFVVIDADYGFLILTGGKGGEELMPVVVKERRGAAKPSGQLKASRTIIDKVIADKVALLSSDAMADSRLEGAKSLMMQKIRSAMCVPLWRKDKIIGVIQLDSVSFHNQFTQDDLELLKAIGSQMALVIEQAALNEQLRQEEHLISRLERFHSPQVIDMILKGGQETKDDIMEPREHLATILFSDIIGFTRLAERMPPRDMNIVLNRYFSHMTDIVFHHDGTLDKYIGDGLMAVFGAPMQREDDADRAIQTALNMKRHLANMMDTMREDWKFDIRIGINTGRVVSGNIGSPKRMDYTVIGDAVNIASRLETMAQPNQILIGEETYKRVRGRFRIQKVGPVLFRGKTKEIMVHEVLG